MNRRKPPLTNRASYKEARGNNSTLGKATRGGVIHSARIAGGGAGSHVNAALQRSSHMFPHRRTGCRIHFCAATNETSKARRAERRSVDCDVWRDALRCRREDQAQGTAGAARAGRPGSGACWPGATAPAHPVPAARGDASGQRGRARLPSASAEGRPGGPVERARHRQLACSVPLQGRRGRGRAANMALALEYIGWGTADHWMRMQASYELAQARRERADAKRQAGLRFA